MVDSSQLPRFPPLTPANGNLEEAQLIQYEYLVDVAEKGYRDTLITKEADGSLQGPFNLLLYTPTIAKPWVDFQQSVGRLLVPIEAETAILGVLSITKTTYGMYAHAILAKKAGCTSAQVEAMLEGTCPSDMTVRQAAIYKLAVKLAQTRGPLDADSFEEAISVLGQSGMIGAIHQSAAFMQASIMMNAADVRLPSSVDN